MQLSAAAQRRRPKPTFSILGRIGGDATKRNGDLLPDTVYAFSILGRIGGDATPCAAHPAQGRTHFQYPRSDRRRCNRLGLRNRFLGKSWEEFGEKHSRFIRPSEHWFDFRDARFISLMDLLPGEEQDVVEEE